MLDKEVRVGTKILVSFPRLVAGIIPQVALKEQFNFRGIFLGLEKIGDPRRMNAWINKTSDMPYSTHCYSDRSGFFFLWYIH